MKQIFAYLALTLAAGLACADASCPEGTSNVCLENGDKVCPASARCVDNSATCFDSFPCDGSEGFVCESKYDEMMHDYRQAVKEHDALAAENVEIREQRLQQKNCVLNADTLAVARSCVR